MTHLITAAVLALAIGAGAWTVTKTQITRPARMWLAKRSGKAWDKLSELFACPYCLSHWLSFGAVILWRPWLVSGDIVGRFLVTSLAMVAMSSLVVTWIKKGLT